MTQMDDLPAPAVRPAPPGAFTVRPGVPDDWDALLGAGSPATLSRRWITLAEGRIPGGARTLALNGGHGPSVALVGGPVAEPTGHVRFDPFRVLSGGSAADGVAELGPHPWRGRAPEDVFPCCLLMFPNYETAPAGPGAHDPVACGRWVDGLVDWARDNGMRSVAGLFLRPDFPVFTDALRERGFDIVPMVDRCDMDVTWQDFDGYLATLPRKRRFAVRRELRDIALAGVVVGERPVGEEEPELVRLRHQIVTKYGGVPDAEREAGSLRHLREHFGPENVTVVEARRDGALLSFSILVRDGAQWTVLMSGTDYDRPDASFTYFATMFYRPAELAPRLGITSMAYGLGTLQAKKLRGCTVNTLSAAALLLDR
ncbi:peptidogalycan biosysnthesis protein [Streptomyces zhihengii]|uniref:N-acetyltransferase n=1 Tax=Streptomyces zhihengii TaxID=1818004 RepID=A0ABS2ULS3_9ACTN|nr:peptidogalycan biosysnthesis protein [Streptomyces zhihengii]MBM9618452.1 N-acetyltransferase [Streptomyces zhihengii]